MLIPSFTFLSVTVIVCAFMTPIKFTVTKFPWTATVLTLPAPLEMIAFVTLTSFAKVKTSW